MAKTAQSSPAKKATTKAKAKSPPAKKKKATAAAKPKGRPHKFGPRPFVCQVPGCGLAYPSSAGLHQHKRTKHPELIVPRGSGSWARKCGCPVDGCGKSYDTSAGLYQHKNAKHPELIRRR